MAKFPSDEWEGPRRAQTYKRKYGITLEEYDELFDQQNGVCAICGLPERKRYRNTDTIVRLSVDHSHVTGEVRGLLCYSCNYKLGWVENNADAIFDYLRDED